MKVLGYIFSWLFVIVFSSLFSGFVLTILWGWFVVPTFHIAPISIPLAIGLSITLGLFTAQRSPTNEDEKAKSQATKLLEAFVFALVYPLMALVIGAVWHAFV